MTLRLEKPRVLIQIVSCATPKNCELVKKTAVPQLARAQPSDIEACLVFASIGNAAFRQSFIGPCDSIKKMEFLDRWHPKVRMISELLVKPARARLLGPDTEKIGA